MMARPLERLRLPMISIPAQQRVWATLTASSMREGNTPVKAMTCISVHIFMAIYLLCDVRHKALTGYGSLQYGPFRRCWGVFPMLRMTTACTLCDQRWTHSRRYTFAVRPQSSNESSNIDYSLKRGSRVVQPSGFSYKST